MAEHRIRTVANKTLFNRNLLMAKQKTDYVYKWCGFVDIFADQLYLF